MTRPCAWCDQDFQPNYKHQQCCSHSCGQFYRQAKHRHETPPPRQTNWRTNPTQERPYKRQHQRLREQLLPRAIGKLCPFYTTDPQCPGLMLHGQRLALDHHIAVALGGTTTLENVRITHHDCNQRAGSRLGGVMRNMNNKRNRYK